MSAAKSKSGSDTKSQTSAKLKARTPAKGGKTDVASLPARKADASDTAIDELLRGKVIARPKATKDKGKKKKTTEKLPEELQELADVLVAGRKIDREIQFKVNFAHQKIQEYCLRRFAERFMETGHRPESTTYATEKSVFSFIQTRRITLTTEKTDALKMLHVSLDGQTELKGLKVNFDAIREHKLEYKLRDALKSIGVSPAVLVECFQPDVQLKESFFEHLSSVIDRSLEKGENGADKMFEVLHVLNPASQIRNAEIPNLGPERSFKLIHDTDIAVTEDLDALED